MCKLALNAQKLLIVFLVGCLVFVQIAYHLSDACVVAFDMSIYLPSVTVTDPNEQLRVRTAYNATKPRHAVIFPEGPDMDLSSFGEALQQLPHLEVFGYPYRSPQANIGSFPHVKGYNRIPRNKANEAMTYLSFIIDNYEDLPDVMLFVHGHTAAWHQVTVLSKIITNLNWGNVTQYVSLANCGKNFLWKRALERRAKKLLERSRKRRLREESITNEPGQDDRVFSYFLKLHKWSKYGLSYHSGFNRFSRPGCCSQFIVPRSAILRLSKKFYVDMRNWIESTKLPDYYSGRMFEFTWHWFFTGNSVGTDLRGTDCRTVFRNYKVFQPCTNVMYCEP